MSVLVSSGCHHRAPQAGWLKQQKFILSLLWRLEVQNQGAVRAGFWRELSCWLADGQHLAVSSYGLSSVHAGRERILERERFLISSNKDTSPIESGPHPYDFI